MPKVAPRKRVHDAALELRKIVVVGYSYDAPEGAPVLDRDGLPLAAVRCPVRMRIAFWVPQPAPYQRRDVGTFFELLRSVVADRHAACGAPVSLVDKPATTLEQYMREHGLTDHALSLADAPRGYTLVHGATERELEALRAGVIVEQVQDFTFPRMPTTSELRTSLLPHWERRAVASLGASPNGAPEQKAAPRLRFASV